MRYNNVIKAAAAVFLILITVPAITAMGKADDVEPQKVRGLENWDHSIDISELEPGEYNIIVRAEDLAGNIGVGGPYNIYIDPSIQIPVVTISNPVADSRAGNKLHAVGTAFDDKGIARVDIAVDEGNFRPAEGTEFWSLSIDSSAWDDGLHVLRARAVDEEGNESPVAEVSFYKDTGKPVIDLVSHSSGSYVSGKIELQGTVTDLNGVAALKISEDDGESFTNVKLKKGENEGEWEFRYSIDTKEVEDGTRVYNFEALDSLGSVSRQSVLFYIDNSPPEMELLSPVEGEMVNGNITLIGHAFDSVGIDSLSYTADNGTEGDVTVYPGNPVWVLPLDYNGFKGREAKINMMLKDTVGNRIEHLFKIPLDAEGNLPEPGLSEASANLVYKGIPTLTGMIQDDDGSEGVIEYSLNGAAVQRFNASGPWMLQLKDANYGLNQVEIKAIDKYGVAGNPVEIEVNREYLHPLIVFDAYTNGEIEERWYPGRVVDSKNPGIITGRVLNAGSVTNLSWQVDGAETGSLVMKPGNTAVEKPFVIKLPKNKDSGKMDVSIKLAAQNGSEFSASTVYYNYLKPEPAEDGSVPEYEYPDSEGCYLIFPDPAFGFAKSGEILLGEGLEISGWTAGSAISSARLSDGSSFLKVDTEGNAFRITPTGEGKAENVVLKLTLENGKEFSSKPMNITSDNTAPVLSFKQPSSGMIIRDEISMSVSDLLNVSDDNEDKYFYSLDGGISFKQFNVSEDFMINSRSLPDGLVDFVLKSEDACGNSSFSYIPLLKDTSAPEIEMITSTFERGAAQITWSGRLTDADSAATVEVLFLPPAQDAVAESDVLEVSLPEAKTFSAVINGKVFSFDVNLTELDFIPSAVEIRAVDEAGNIKIDNLKFDSDLNAGRPIVDIQVPEELSTSETDFNMSGLIIDKEGVKSIEYSLNDGAFVKAGSGSLFNVPLKLENMLDDLNTLKVKAVDVNGLESEVASRSFLISLEEPEIKIEYPDLETVVRGTIELKGSSSDVNGIDSVFISHDNGNTFQKADGQEDWHYNLDTNLLDDGVSSILIRARDKAGVVSYYTTLLNVDNTAPLISLSHPADGEKFRGALSVDGRVSDNGEVRMFRIILSPLDTSGETVHEIDTRGILHDNIDLSGFSPGSYSFRAEAVDNAENISSVSRVIELLPDEINPPVLLSPLPGEVTGPIFSIQGYLSEPVSKVIVMINGEIFKALDVSANGYFRYNITPEDGLAAGDNKLSLKVENSSAVVETVPVSIEYSTDGIWTSIDNVSHHQYVSDRYVIEGSSGYLTELEDEKAMEKLQPDSVQISLDGGKTFDRCSIKDGKWSYRLYSSEIPDGDIDILVHASNTYEHAYARCQAVMDSQAPVLSLLSPGENEHLFEDLFLSGEVKDESGLADVNLSLREGDKDSYETPSFIQGMYFDASALGATYFTTGLGLTFMDDNVKLQLQYGYAPTTVIDEETGRERAARFGGNVFGAKLLANLAQIPFSWLLGPEWSFMSASAAVGANFSYFSSNTADSADSWGIILAGVVGQLEVPKITFEDRSFIKYVSAFWEGQMWLISSDVSPEVVLLPSFGIRVGLF